MSNGGMMKANKRHKGTLVSEDSPSDTKPF